MLKNKPTSAAGRIIALMDEYPMISKAQEIEYAKANNQEMLVLSNLRLAVYMAKGKVGMGLEFDDLVQIAVIGLCEAAKTFDINRNVKFATHAFNSVRKELNRALSITGRTIRIPEWLISTKLRENRENE